MANNAHSYHYAINALQLLFQTKLPKDDSYKQEWHDDANNDPQELGLNISNEQLEEMRGQLDNIDFQEAAAEERKVADHQDEVSSSC